jgi:hypothetical protein
MVTRGWGNHILPLGSLSHQGRCNKQNTVLLDGKAYNITEGECCHTITIEW